jgi:hypothetical protein
MKQKALRLVTIDNEIRVLSIESFVEIKTVNFITQIILKEGEIVQVIDTEYEIRRYLGI